MTMISHLGQYHNSDTKCYIMVIIQQKYINNPIMNDDCKLLLVGYNTNIADIRHNL